MPGEIEQAKASGAMEYWTKPIRLERFVADLRRVLADTTWREIVLWSRNPFESLISPRSENFSRWRCRA